VVDRSVVGRRELVDRADVAVLEALPGMAALLDATGAIDAVNTLWHSTRLHVGSTALTLHVGVNLSERLRAAAAEQPSEIARTLLELAAAVDDVVTRDHRRTSVSGEGLPGFVSHPEITIAALPDPPGGALVTIADADERIASRQRLTLETTHDNLTALPNRTLFLDRVTNALARPARGPVAVLHIDLDRFRLVNALSGPAYGDRVLAAVARRVASILASGESAARAGDDSFAILSEAVASEAEAIGLAARLLGLIAEPLVLDEREVVLAASIGVAVAEPGITTSAEELLRDAEVATREAKEQGGGHAVVAHHDMTAASVYRMEVEQALRVALDHDELSLEFQPEVSLETGAVVGAEALLRWSHPVLGGMGPSEFIGIAEETGLIHTIGAWVLRQACRQAAAWSLPADASGMYVAVNVSGHQLGDPGLVDLVQLTLAETGLAPERLCLEVTESVMLSSLSVARQALTDLRAIGVRIALDDFGTGYASFEYLLRLPIDLVKLDGSFIAHLASDPHDRAVVEAMVGLSRRLGLQLVAEGVEDERQRAVLASLGCDVVQGYETGRPADEATLLGTVWRRFLGRQ
jgi:diguanylate cyclase (GGDEF)-like protein